MNWRSIPEHLSEAGAHELARRLTGFYDRRGAVVMTRIVKCYTERESALYCVRSTLCNGLPIEHKAVRYGRDANVAAQAAHLEDRGAVSPSGPEA